MITENSRKHLPNNINTRDNLDILGKLELYRTDIRNRLDKDRRVSLGQYITSSSVARLMASMLTVANEEAVDLLDPGAGIGTLFAACVENFCQKTSPPKMISVTAFEIEPIFMDYLEETVDICRTACENRGIELNVQIIQSDFIKAAVSMIEKNKKRDSAGIYTHAILNPPYGKVSLDSYVKKELLRINIIISNLYTAFLSLTAMLIRENGQVVSITPRSFCNGPYFKPFRKQLLERMSIERIHLFHSREEAFREDSVLQENVIMRMRRSNSSSARVLISSSISADDELINTYEAARTQVVNPDDENAFIHIITDELESRVAALMQRFNSTPDDLGLEVSTGRVVDFRIKEFLLNEQESGTIPLIYPINFEQGFIKWPIRSKRRPMAIRVCPETFELLVPSVNYVLVKRFSSKEERRRIVAAVYDSNQFENELIGFENHVNYFYMKQGNLYLDIAKGLALFLNSSIVDMYFRHFSGHTQVNAVDLRQLKYPTLDELSKIGKYVGYEFPEQKDIDRIIEKELFDMSSIAPNDNPLTAKSKIDEALAILKQLGFPREQQNERSALTLLSLLDLKPNSSWSDSKAPLIGITPMMDFFAEHYGKEYKPNTRETVRRQTVHQFLDAGLITLNPDEPSRPINSPKYVYQIEQGALELLRTYNTTQWDDNLQSYSASRQTLVQRYAKERKMKRIPITIKNGKTITLSPGGQNILVAQIVNEFAPRFTPRGEPVYIGDTDDKFAYFDKDLLKSLGIEIDPHGKMPDVVIYFRKKNWLVLIEAVTSHGPVNPKRHKELSTLFQDCSAGLVFVTAFLSRHEMGVYLKDISWETEVWVAESPSHLIHFNGERFLGPYE